MAEDATTQEETQETGIDYKAESRKWERRAKENRKELEALKAEAETKADAEKSAAERIAALEARLAESEARERREKLVRGIAQTKGVDPEVLLLMVGDDEDSVTSNADLLMRSRKPKWEPVADEGNQKAPRMTKEQILAIKNPRKQLEAIAQNKDLFRE